MNSATSSVRSAASSASRSPNGTREKPGSSGWKRSENAGSPDAESAPSVSPWKPRSTETHARATRRRPPDLDRRLDRLRPGAREEHAAEARGRPLQQLVGEDRAQRVDAERELPRRVELERFQERRLHPRVVAADVVHPEAAEPVEIAVPVGVVEMGTLGARPAAVEADRPQHAHELRVDDPRVELQLLARMPLQQLGDAEARHALSLARHTREVESPDGWDEVDGALEREFRFPDFAAAMSFVNRVATLAEAENHHPDIAVHYNRVTLRWWTHTAGGVTDRDRDLAARTNELH